MMRDSKEVTMHLSNLRKRMTRGTIGVFIAALALATGAFWSVMLTSPPVTVAAQEAFSIESILRNAPRDLLVIEADTF
jgi:hypothetical protein